jgi:hypothetical protein
MRVSEMSTTYGLLCEMTGANRGGGEWMTTILRELARRIDTYWDDQKAAAEDAEAQRRAGEAKRT